jgi:hypothetical protein
MGSICRPDSLDLTAELDPISGKRPAFSRCRSRISFCRSVKTWDSRGLISRTEEGSIAANWTCESSCLSRGVTVRRLVAAGFLASLREAGDLDRAEVGRGVSLRLLDRVEGNLGRLKSSNESMNEGCCPAHPTLKDSSPGNTTSAWGCNWTRAALSSSG